MVGSGNNSAIFQYYLQPLSAEASAQQTVQWLQTNRFSSHVRTFGLFAGADILRLSRDDLIQICGLADGIRLFNALHAKYYLDRMIIRNSVNQFVFHFKGSGTPVDSLLDAGSEPSFPCSFPGKPFLRRNRQ